MNHEYVIASLDSEPIDGATVATDNRHAALTFDIGATTAPTSTVNRASTSRPLYDSTKLGCAD